MNILITGGASGLGEKITIKFAEDEGNTVYFTYSNSELIAKQIENTFSNTIAIKCDFKNKLEVNSICERIQNLKLDVLINNAYSGTFLSKHFHKIEIDNFQNEFEVNILPTVNITQAAINSFRKNKKGKIITILSAALLNTPPIGSSIYVANKAYLLQLTKSWAIENSKFNITSNSISPSFMKTSMTSDMDDRMVEMIIENHPLKRLLTTEEVAETVQFLSTASDHINGQNIIMNASENI